MLTVEKTDFNGRSTTHQYDINDRLTQINHADGRTTLFQYNTNGQRTRSEQRFTNGAVEVTTYAYDERSRLTEVTYPDSSFVRYAYDASGNRTQVVTPSATIDYTYDELSRLETVIAPEGTSSYGYDPVGNRASETKPNGVTTTYTYNPRNQLTRMQHATAAGAVLLGLSYTLDASGMRHGIAEFAGPSEAALELRTTRDYTYDPLMRLTAETVSCGAGNSLCAPRTTTWTYDAVENRQLQTENRGGSVATKSYVYDANDRLLSSVLAGVPVNGDVVGTTTNRYDANGNLIESIEPAESGSKKTAYGWDSDDKLVSAVITESVDGESVSTESRYTYNADGIRRTQTARFGAVDATTIQYLIDPNQAYAQVLEETVRPAVQGGAGQLVVRYTYGDDLLAQVRTGVDTPNVEAGAGLPSSAASTSFYHYDGLGTTRLLTDVSGAVTDQYGFEAFGEKDEAASIGSTANNYLYTGEQYDPNLGFYYLRARYMNPVSASFVSMDVFSGLQNDPVTLHKYLYANGNPVHNTDPSGYFSLTEMGTALGVAANLQTIASFGINLATGNFAGATKDAAELALAFFTGPGGKPVAESMVRLAGLVRKTKLDLSSPGSGKILTENMQRLYGGAKPVNTQAHHVIPTNPISADGKRALKLLSDSKININNPLNGIFLAGCKSTVGVVGAIHCGSHAKAYEEMLYGMLVQAGATTAKKGSAAMQAAVTNGIAAMKECLMLGTCVLNKRGALQ